jgi:hypothetical protein
VVSEIVWRSKPVMGESLRLLGWRLAPVVTGHQATAANGAWRSGRVRSSKCRRRSMRA